MERDLLTPKEVAEEVRVTERTVYNWLYAGQLRALRAGRFWRIQRSEIEEFLNRRHGRAEHDDASRAYAPAKSSISTHDEPMTMWAPSLSPRDTRRQSSRELLRSSPDLAEELPALAKGPTRSRDSTGLVSYRASENAVLCVADQPDELLGLAHERRCVVCNNILAHDDERCPGRHHDGPLRHTVSWSERPRNLTE